jgi:hypothetical protein
MKNNNERRSYQCEAIFSLGENMDEVDAESTPGKARPCGSGPASGKPSGPGTMDMMFAGSERGNCEALAPLARMILVFESMRSVANDRAVLTVPVHDAKIEQSRSDASPQTGWAPGILAEIHSMFERDWTPEPINRQDARLYGRTISPRNDTCALPGMVETPRS